MRTTVEETTEAFRTTESGAEVTSEGLRSTEDGSEEDSEWVRKADAASRLGISERTIENRVNAGKLRKRFRNDGAVEILVPKLQEDVQVDKALVLLDRYNVAMAQQVAPLVEKIATQAETIGELRAQLQQAQERISLLEAPQTATNTPVVENRPENVSPRRWWAFWNRTPQTS